jgi:hypothetical protein
MLISRHFHRDIRPRVSARMKSGLLSQLLLAAATVSSVSANTIVKRDTISDLITDIEQATTCAACQVLSIFPQWKRVC